MRVCAKTGIEYNLPKALFSFPFGLVLIFIAQRHSLDLSESRSTLTLLARPKVPPPRDLSEWHAQ